MIKKKKEGNLLLDIYNSIKQGESPSNICKKISISNQLMSYYLKRLKSKELIKKIGYGVWKTTKTSSRVAEIRGHAFMWKVKHNLEINWIKKLNKQKVKYKLIGMYKTPRIIFKKRKIWLGKSNIIIYEPESFLGDNAIEVRKYVVFRLLTILGALERELDINLGHYEFTVSRQHYSIIKNSLAIQCNKTGQKIEVYNKKGLWFLVDNSYNLKECEQVHPETALLDNLGVQRYFNEHKDTKFQVTPKFILESIKGLVKVSENRKEADIMMVKNQVLHFDLLKGIKKELGGLGKAISKVIKENKDLRLKVKNQRTLSDF